MEYQDLVIAALALPDEKLAALTQAIRAEREDRRGRKARAARSTLTPGTTVRVLPEGMRRGGRHAWVFEKEGKLLEIMRSKGTVQFTNPYTEETVRLVVPLANIQEVT